MRHLLLAALISGILVPICAQAPHILWITIEDTSPQFIGCYGNREARTAAIDRLGKEGIIFTSGFSTGTVCSPSRSTLITACRTNALGTGHHRSRYPIPDYIRGFPSYLRDAGYYTSNNSKTDYNSSEAARIIQESWDESSPRAGWWNRKPGQPFFAVFNFIDSHESRVMTNPWEVYKNQVLDQLGEAERIDPAEVTMPPFLRDTPEMRREHSRIYNGLHLTDKKIDTLLTALKADGLMDSTIIFFFADHGEAMPRGKSNSIGLGYRVPFIIWLPEMYQHLSPWGIKTVTDEPVCFMDLAPTLLSLAGIGIPGYMEGRALLGDQRADAGTYLFLSNDRSGEARDLERSVTDGQFLYTRVYMPHLPEHRWQKYHDYAAISEIMNKDYRQGKLSRLQGLTFQHREAEYLYDLGKDPWELYNLAADPELSLELQRFRKVLDEHLLKIRDIHFLPEYELDSISRTSTPFEYRMNELCYPFEMIFEAASMSGMGEEVLDEQLRLLDHSSGVVRYWAALGLRAQKRLPESSRETILKILHDPYLPARIALYGVAQHFFGSPTAGKGLSRCLRAHHPHLALQAVQTLLYLEEEKARTFLPEIRQLFEELEGNKA